MTTRYSRRAIACALLAGTCLAAQAHAQVAGSLPIPPVRQTIDENGVDVIRGTLVLAEPALSIGPDARRGLVYSRGTFNTQLATIEPDGAGGAIVTLGGQSDHFSQSGGVFTSTEANGAALVLSGGIYTYTARDGTAARFASNAGYPYAFYYGELGRLGSITYADGTTVSYGWQVRTYCPDYETGICNSGYFYVGRLLSVTNSNGYQLKMSYASNAVGQLTQTNFDAWSRLTRVTAINNAVEYCDPSANSCTLTGVWPHIDYGSGTDGSGRPYQSVTDPLGRTTQYGANWMRRPGSTVDNLTYATDPMTGQVTSLTHDGVSYSYAYANNGTVVTTTVTDPAGGQRIYTSPIGTGVLSSFRDETSRTTSYQHDGSGRLTEVAAPEGDKTQITYDARGNATETRQVAKPGSGLADIVATAGFPASCTNPKTCNKPDWTKDAAGNQTDFTYDGTHGGVLTVTLPAPSAGAVRPQVRTSYTGLQAYYRQSASGAPAASGFTTYLPTGISACQTLASCAGTADEVKTSVSYGPQTAGTANNLLPASTSSGAGDGSLTATTAVTYDNIGNAAYMDGPLAGTADTTRTLYDAARQVVGTIGPDPDGAGGLKNRAVRLTYNPDGQVATAEQGTTAGQSDAAWSGFQPLQWVWSSYDANGRKRTDELRAGANSYQATQYSYDALGRTECVMVRMNPLFFGALPAEPGCTALTPNSFGPDRITKASYDAASRLTATTSGYGTAEAGSDGTLTFTTNGKPQSFTDGEGHVTTLEYDGFDRLSKTRYPNASGSGSSTTDYEQLSYDARSLVTSRRLRDGNSIGYTYDALGRVTYKDVPGIAYYDTDVSYTYDLLGRLASAVNATGETIGYSHDALGRLTGETNNIFGGTRALQYDLAGRATRLSYPDGFYVTYGYDLTGAMTEVRESGTVLIASFAYDDLGRRVSLTRGNGSSTGYGYDGISRLTSLTDDLAGTAYDQTITLSYNPAGQIVSRTGSNDAYAYTGHANADLTETSNGLNQLTAQGSTSLGYDGRGSVATIGGTSYGYTSENRLTTMNGGTTALAYDAAGRLFYTGNASPTYYDHAGDRMIGEAQGGVLTRRYVWGPGADEPLVVYDVPAAYKMFLSADERGSIVAVSDASGGVLAVNKYDDYGQPQGALSGRFGYTGQAWLPEIGLQYSKARMYAPGLGRFMQSDPIGLSAGQNLYGYVAGDPVNATDPSGLDRTIEDQRHVQPYNPNELHECTGSLIARKDCNEIAGFGVASGVTSSISSGGVGGMKVQPDGTIIVPAPLPTSTVGSLSDIRAPGLQLASGFSESDCLTPTCVSVITSPAKIFDILDKHRGNTSKSVFSARLSSPASLSANITATLKTALPKALPFDSNRLVYTRLFDYTTGIDRGNHISYALTVVVELTGLVNSQGQRIVSLITAYPGFAENVDY